MMEKAHIAIILCLGDKALREVSKELTAKGVWDKLESLYMVKTLANRLYMKHKLYAFRMVDEKPILEQLDEFNKILDNLENIDIKMEEEDKALIFLSALPKSFENFKDTFLFGRQSSLTLEDVLVALKSKELQKATDQASSSTGEGLTVKGKHQKKCNFKKENTNKWQNKKVFDVTTDTEVRKCFHCHEPGHYKKNCPKWKTFMKKLKGKGQDNQANPTVDNEKASGYDSAEVLSIISAEVSSEWVLDSGCSFHMNPIREWFQDFQNQDGGSVLLGNDQTCRVKGISSVRIRMFDGVTRVRRNVRYVPDLRRNLISLGMFDSVGYSFQSENGELKVSRGNSVVMKGVRRNDLYFLLGSTVLSQVDVVKEKDNTLLWHSRLAHVSERGLQELSKQNLLCGDKISKLELCEHCVCKVYIAICPSAAHGKWRNEVSADRCIS
ncbi:hypothetical protein ACS0TY_013272 [Phlomoides rotata]